MRASIIDNEILNSALHANKYYQMAIRIKKKAKQPKNKIPHINSGTKPPIAPSISLYQVMKRENSFHAGMPNNRQLNDNKFSENAKLNASIEHRNVIVENQEVLTKIKNSFKPVIFISGHFNNFELMAMQIEKAGIELATIYRPLNNFLLNKTMEQIRTENICKNQIKKGRAGTREIIKNLIKGKSIAIMIDQRVREGIKTDFFNNQATTTTIPAQLIKKYNCELVPVYIERRKNNYFKMFVSKPLKINKNKSVLEITKFLNNLLERMILRNIDQWIWTHNRWKDQ